MSACNEQKAPPSAASAATNPVTQTVQLPTLRVVTDAQYPPFAFVGKNRQVEGLDVDMFTAVARNQGYNVEFIPTDWEGIFKNLEQKTADVVVSAVSHSDESEAAAALSNPYYRSPYRVAALKNSHTDLSKWTSATHIGIASTEDSAEDLPERFKVKTSQIKAYPTVFAALQGAANGEVNVVVADSTVLQYHINSDTFVKNNLLFESVALPAGRGANLVFAVAKDNPELLAELNTGLTHIRQSGEYQQILQKWGQEMPKDMDAAASASSANQ